MKLNYSISYIGENSRRNRLKSTAIPSVNLPKSSVAVQSPKKRCSPKKRLVLQKHDKNVSSFGEQSKVKLITIQHSQVFDLRFVNNCWDIIIPGIS